MVAADVEGAEMAWHEAFSAMRAARGLPVAERTAAAVENTRARLRHLLRTDPKGSYIAAYDGGVVGVAQSLVREGLWVLAILGVVPRAQGNGVGRQLLDAAIAYAPDSPGVILSSPDGAAIRRYVDAGFDLHPAVAARGFVHASDGSVPEASSVRAGTADDLAAAADVDRAVRGATRLTDLEFLLDEGARLLVLGGDGYAVVHGGRPYIVAARTEQSAATLLHAALGLAAPDQEVALEWLTAPHQWAIRAAVRAGLRIEPSGPLMLRGIAAPPRAYLPAGMFG
jgi:GNAT superfamily N-acetyltransferase